MPLTGPMVSTLAICLLALVLFVWTRLPFEVVGLILLVVLALSGILSPEQAISGFANEATVTVAAILFLSAGLERTGMVDLVGRAIGRLGRGSELRMQAVLITAAVISSAFLNNTAVVAMLIPVLRGLSRTRGIPPSRLLMPLSFSSQFGGTLTLIGTSTNLLVSGLLVAEGLPGLGLFEFTGAALPLVAAGSIYLLTLGRVLLPDRGSAGDDAESAPFRDFQSVLLVEYGSQHVGTSATQLRFPGREELRITEIRRGPGHVDFDAPLQGGDILLVEGVGEALARASRSPGLIIPGAGSGVLTEEDGAIAPMEAVVPPRSRLIGRSVRNVGPLTWNGAVVLAIQRQNVRIDRPGARLEAGDLLLVEGTRAALHRLQRSGLLLLIGSVEIPAPRRKKRWLAGGIFAAVVLLAAFGVMPIMVSALLGVIAMTLTRCISPGQAYEHIDWGVLILLGSLIPLGLAMQETGTAAWIAHWILSLTEGLRPRFALALIYLATSVLTEFISNNASVVLLVPVALAVAEGMGFSPMPLVIGVMFAASNSFMTPVGYQTNTFVFGPGRYRFTDFARVGAPLSLLYLLLTVLVIPLFFPF